MRLALGLLTLLLLMALPPSAVAAQTAPMNETAVTPAGGTSVVSGSYGFSQEFSVTAPQLHGSGSVEVEIARANLPGQDGTLAEDYKVASGTLSPRDSDPATFRGTVTAFGPALQPGTYFFQFAARRYGTACGEDPASSCVALSSVYELHVTAAVPPATASFPAPSVPPYGAIPEPEETEGDPATSEKPKRTSRPSTPRRVPRLTFRAAKRYIRTALRREFDTAYTAGYGRSLDRCRRVSRTRVSCRASWYIGDGIYTGRVKLWLSRESDGIYWNSSHVIRLIDDLCRSTGGSDCVTVYRS